MEGSCDTQGCEMLPWGMNAPPSRAFRQRVMVAHTVQKLAGLIEKRTLSGKGMTC